MKGLPNKPKDCPYSDKSWETYNIITGCLNSLNVRTKLASTNGDSNLADLLSQTQNVILQLLRETGRIDEFFTEERDSLTIKQ